MGRREQLGPKAMRQEQTPEALLTTRVLVWYWMSEQEEVDVGEEEGVVIQATRQTGL